MRNRTHSAARTGTVRPLHAALGAAAAGLIAFAGAASPAFAHDVLVGYDTGDHSVTLQFNNDVLDVGSEIIVTAPDGSDPTDGAPVVSGRDVTQNLVEDLADGEYDMDWRVVSSDGHPIQNELTFTVADGVVDAITVPEAHEHEHEEAAEEGHSHEHSDDAAEHSHDDAAEHPHDDAADEYEAGASETDYEADASDSGLSAGAITGISIGGAAVVIVVIVAIVVGQRRRRTAMGSDQQ